MDNTNQLKSEKDLRSKYVKLHVNDWLLEIDSKLQTDDFCEVRFKNERKDYFKNRNKLPLQVGDIVAVEANAGHDIGIVSLTGPLVSLQLKRKTPSFKQGKFKIIYRKARKSDIDNWEKAIAKESNAIIQSRKIVEDLGLNMKISDVEYQGDVTKATFYYIADERVDFRELIHVLANHFQVRIEMKQIGARQEAAKIGGIGSCGREICCSTFKCNFESIPTNAARYQDLPFNTEKLTGQCGKLKCCLNFEVDAYIDAQIDFPNNSKDLYTQNAVYKFAKSDIFRGVYWYINKDSKSSEIVALSVERVKEILSMNENDEKPETLVSQKELKSVKKETTFENNVGKDDVNRFETKKRAKHRRKYKRKRTK